MYNRTEVIREPTGVARDIIVIVWQSELAPDKETNCFLLRK